MPTRRVCKTRASWGFALGMNLSGNYGTCPRVGPGMNAAKPLGPFVPQGSREMIHGGTVFRICEGFEYEHWSPANKRARPVNNGNAWPWSKYRFTQACMATENETSKDFLT